MNSHWARHASRSSVVLRINQWKYSTFYCIICHSTRFLG